MATSKPAAAAAAPAEPVKKSKGRLLIIIALVVVLLAGGGGAAWYFLIHKAEDAEESPKKKKKPVAVAPVFAPMDSFTVNLQAEGVEQFLQTAFTLQVEGPADVDAIKLHLPLVRSRILLLLSSKRSNEISTVEGKKKLAEEIIAQLKIPFSPDGTPLNVSDVFFTQFVIQ